MNVKTVQVPVIGRIPTVIPLIIGIVLIFAGAFVWISRPARPVGMEGDSRPIGFSLGLSSEWVSHIDRQGASTFWAGSGRIFKNGFAGGAAAIWSEFERAAPDKTLVPVKIIPSGGLYPYSISSSFAGEIATFVKKGGSLICLGQPLGSMYRKLPGSPRAIGWVEMAEDPLNSTGRVSVAMDHPALTGLSEGEFAAHFSGFFTEIPSGDQAQILLHDVDTGRPVLIAYRYGAGLVIAGTLVCDAALLGEKPKGQEALLLEQLLRFAQSGGVDLPLYEAGDTTDMIYEFKGDPGSGQNGMVELYSPAGVLESGFEVELPDEGTQVIKPFVMSEPRGIWRLVTYRRGADGKPAGPQSATWFAVGHAPVEPVAGGFHCTISVPGSYLPPDVLVPVTIHMWNDGPTEMEITYQAQAGVRTVKLGPGKDKHPVDEVALNGVGSHDLEYQIYGGDGKKLVTLKRRVETGPTDRVFLVAKAPRSAAPGQTVPVTLRAFSVNPGRFEADCILRLSLGGKTVWQDTRKYTLYGADYSEQTVKVPIPSGEKGSYVLEAVLTYMGQELTRVWTELEAAHQ